MVSLGGGFEGGGAYTMTYCSTLHGKFHLKCPFLGIARPQSQFLHSCAGD